MSLRCCFFEWKNNTKCETHIRRLGMEFSRERKHCYEKNQNDVLCSVIVNVAEFLLHCEYLWNDLKQYTCVDICSITPFAGNARWIASFFEFSVIAGSHHSFCRWVVLHWLILNTSTFIILSFRENQIVVPLIYKNFPKSYFFSWVKIYWNDSKMKTR